MLFRQSKYIKNSVVWAKRFSMDCRVLSNIDRRYLCAGSSLGNFDGLTGGGSAFVFPTSFPTLELTPRATCSCFCASNRYLLNIVCGPPSLSCLSRDEVDRSPWVSPSFASVEYASSAEAMPPSMHFKFADFPFRCFDASLLESSPPRSSRISIVMCRG